MSQVTASLSMSPKPLTALTEEEALFRENVLRFAEDKIRPKVKEMDEREVFEPALIDNFFQQIGRAHV